MKYQNPALLIFILLYGFQLNAQDDHQNHPATSQDIIISIGNDSIAGYGLFASGAGKKETVLLLHGLPGNERNFDVAQELRRNGRNVIFFNYRGTWGSQGEFMYSNCIEDVTKVLDYFSVPAHADRYNVKSDSFVLFGHSMGGGVALISGAEDPRVKKIAIYSPYNVALAARDPQSLTGARNHLKSLFMLKVDPDRFIGELIDRTDEYNPLTYQKALSHKKLLIFDENERNKEWIDQLDGAQYILMKTDHAFSDKRLEMIDRVSEWLEE